MTEPLDDLMAWTMKNLDPFFRLNAQLSLIHKLKENAILRSGVRFKFNINGPHTLVSELPEETQKSLATLNEMEAELKRKYHQRLPVVDPKEN